MQGNWSKELNESTSEAVDHQPRQQYPIYYNLSNNKKEFQNP